MGEVVGNKKFYIVILLAVQTCCGVNSIFYILLLRNVIDSAVAGKKSSMQLYIMAFAGLVLLQIALRALVRYLTELSKSSYENAFKERLFSQLLTRDYGAVTAVHSGEWMNRLTSDTVVVADGMATILPETGGMLVKLIGAVGMLVLLEPRFGSLAIPAGGLLVTLTYVFRKRLKALHKRMQEKDGAVRVTFQDYLSSLMVVKAFSQEQSAENAASLKMAEHKQARMQKNYFSNLCNIGFATLMQGAYVLGAVYGAVGIYSGTLSYGTMTAVMQLIGQIQSPFANISGYLPKYYAMLASAERLMEVEALLLDEGGEPSQRCAEERAISMEDVSFTYDREGEKALPVLTHFNLFIRKGEFIAFTGESGCGKSTVLKLLLRLYQPDCGRVHTYSRDCFAYVPQGNMLMSGSIRDVISFADEGLRRDDARLFHALELACAREFVSSLENGLDTVLGERGSGLSEGQMQRLSIARAILSDRPVLLLDEATSALDEQTEEQVLSHLRAMQNKTVIIVTHRPQALRICDRQISFGGERTL